MRLAYPDELELVDLYASRPHFPCHCERRPLNLWRHCDDKGGENLRTPP
jgi:hypothetical protein